MVTEKTQSKDSSQPASQEVAGRSSGQSSKPCVGSLQERGLQREKERPLPMVFTSGSDTLSCDPCPMQQAFSVQNSPARALSAQQKDVHAGSPASEGSRRVPGLSHFQMPFSRTSATSLEFPARHVGRSHRASRNKAGHTCHPSTSEGEAGLKVGRHLTSK